MITYFLHNYEANKTKKEVLILLFANVLHYLINLPAEFLH